MQKCWSYGATIEDFLKDDATRILGCLNDASSNFCILQTQIDAWKGEINLLKDVLGEFSSASNKIYFEYNLMRYSKRVDVVLILNGVLCCLEFKVKTSADDATTYSLQDKIQAKEYADEFSQFHSESHHCPIVPILIVSNAPNRNDKIEVCCDNILEVICTNAVGLKEVLEKIIAYSFPEYMVRLNDLAKWEEGDYQTVPTIVQAADRLFENQNVEAITRSGTDVTKTMDSLANIIRKAESTKSRVICFVTGEPGAGKTLVGLKLAAERLEASSPIDTKDSLIRKVFLSGNYPLVKVLKESLVRNFYGHLAKYQELLKDNKTCLSEEQLKFITSCGFEVKETTQKSGKKKRGLYTIKEYGDKGKRREEVDPNSKMEFKTRGMSKTYVSSIVSSMIQLVSHFRRGFELSQNPPTENVFIFDEAQRAWSAAQVKQKDKKTHPEQVKNGWSEPRTLLEYLNRHGENDWCVAVALVGTGQDIHSGEAGIEEWYKALQDGKETLGDWKVCVADHLRKTKAFQSVFATQEERINPWKDLDYKHLHLSETMRSFKSQNVGAFVNALIQGREGVETAKELLPGMTEFPVYLTRDIELAKKWIQKVSLNGSRTCGMVISSRAVRLRRYGFYAQANSFDEVQWFLEKVNHINSSNALEVTATEFKVQGLELDYVLVGWDGDFLYDDVSGKFLTRHFALKADQWKEVKKIEKEEETGSIEEEGVNVDPKDRDRHLRNAYRVILTRARQGMVIFVPKGESTYENGNLDPKNYDPTYNFLHDEIGIPDLED